MQTLYKKTSLTFPSDHSVFEVSRCVHKQSHREYGYDFCLECTTCLVCGKSLVHSNIYNYADAVRQVHCHWACGKLLLHKDMSSVEFSIPIGNPNEVEVSFSIKDDARQCETCKFVLKEDESILQVYNKNNEMVTIHPRCVDSLSCYVCNTFSFNMSNFMLEGNIIRHATCIPLPCVFCKNNENVRALPVGDTQWRFFFHDDCLSAQTCEYCGIHGGNFRHDGVILRHAENCTSNKCLICDIIVGPTQFIDFGDDKVAHLECMTTVTCSKCNSKPVFEGNGLGFGKIAKESNPEGELTYVNGYFRHIKECSSEICPICIKVISLAEKLILDDDKTYHRACLDTIVCSICQDVGHGKKIRHGELFRHKNCNPTYCKGCSIQIGKWAIRKINGESYHGEIDRNCCGPICKSCNLYTINDPKTLIISPDGNYRHKNCIDDDCIVCSKPLGNPDLISDVFTSGKTLTIHNKCRFDCKCGSINADWVKIEKDQIISEANKKSLSRRLKDSATVLYGILKQIKTSIVSDNGKVLKFSMPKKIQQNIVNIWLHKELSGGMHWLPIRKDIFDVRTICIHDRCIGEKCVCGDTLSWTQPLPTYGCLKTRCVNVINALRDIMVYVLKADIKRDWPFSEKEGYEEIKSKMLRIPAFKLTTYTLSIYFAKMPIIEQIMKKRRVDDRGF